MNTETPVDDQALRAWSCWLDAYASWLMQAAIMLSQPQLALLVAPPPPTGPVVDDPTVRLRIMLAQQSVEALRGQATRARSADLQAAHAYTSWNH